MNEAVTGEQEGLQDDEIARAQELKQSYDRVRDEVAKVIHGQENVVELVLRVFDLFHEVGRTTHHTRVRQAGLTPGAVLVGRHRLG